MNMNYMQEPYRPEIPKDYDRLRALGFEVHELVRARDVPKPRQHIAELFGADSVLAYYLMHGLFHSLEYGRNRGVLDFKRRDRKAIQMHSLDAALKPVVRLMDKIPSGYLLNNGREINGGFVHDVSEEVGRTPLGALVFIDYIGHVLGDQTRNDSILLTNYNALISDFHEKGIKNLPVVDHEGVYQVIKSGRKRLDKGRIGDSTIPRIYSKIETALNDFRDYVGRNVNWDGSGGAEEKKRLLGIIDTLIRAVPSRSDMLERGTAIEYLRTRYDKALSVMQNAKTNGYSTLDERLILKGEPEFLIGLKNTFYGDFINDIMISLKMYGNVAPAIIKVAESTGTAATMDSNLVNARSIFAKGVITTKEAVQAVNGTKVDTQKFQRAIFYFQKNLDASLDRIYRSYTGNGKKDELRDSSWDDEIKAFAYMLEESKKLEELVKEYGPPSWISDLVRTAATNLSLL